VDDYVDTNFPPSYQAGTLILWVSPDSAVGTAQEDFVGCRDSAGDDQILMENWDNGDSYWGIRVGATNYIVTITDPWPSVWFMATVGWDIGAGTGEVFWNDNSKGTFSPSGTFTVPDMYLGANNNRQTGAVTNYVDGQIAWCLFYDRKLPDSEVLEIFNETRVLYGV